MEYKRIFKDGIHLLAGKVGTSIIGLVSLMILARILTTEEMGKYSLFLMIVNLALIIGLNWSDSSIVRHGREEYVKTKKINKSFWARMYLFIPVIIFISTILFIFHKQITDYIGIESKLIILIASVFILNGLLNFISYIHQSTDNMKKSAYVLLSQKALFLISLGIILLNAKSTNLTLILIWMNLSFLIAVIFNLFFFNYESLRPYRFDKKYFKKIWAYSWPHLIGFPGLYLINYIDIYVIKKYMTLHDVGVYSIAYSGFNTIAGVIMLIFVVFFPLIVEYKTKKQYKKIKNYMKNIPLYTGIWTVLVIIGLFFSEFIITTIFSTKYIEAIPSFNILLIASIIYFISICLLPIVNAFDLILYAQIFNLIKAATNIIADFILVPKIGIIGAAYGTLISYTVGLLLTILLIKINWKKITGKTK
ncbi:MAG: oligosaccharide flippase family protein [Candidatus Nanoarchaeia archaeon]